jgi:hypothetical protein
LVIADLRKLDAAAFWFVMDNRGWLHLYDERGRRRTHEDLPSSVKGLRDDPFRTLAGELRRSGGFAKETIPFAVPLPFGGKVRQIMVDIDTRRGVGDRAEHRVDQ